MQAEGKRRRCLALGKPIDLVVEQDVGHVEVAAAGVYEVPGADAEAVAVAANAHHRQLGFRQLDAVGEGQQPTVQRVHAVDGEVVRRLARAADAAHDGHLVCLEAHLGQRLLEGSDDPEVAATGAPVVGVRDLEVLGGEFSFFSRRGAHDGHSTAG